MGGGGGGGGGNISTCPWHETLNLRTLTRKVNERGGKHIMGEADS